VAPVTSSAPAAAPAMPDEAQAAAQEKAQDAAGDKAQDAAQPANAVAQTSSSSAAKPQMTILVCTECRPPDGCDTRPRPGEQLAAATRAANSHDDICVATVQCLGNCKRRLSASLVTPGCWSYVFGDLAIENASDLIAGAMLMRDSKNGLMPWRGRPQCLKKGLVARIPPLSPQPPEALQPPRPPETLQSPQPLQPPRPPSK